MALHTGAKNISCLFVLNCLTKTGTTIKHTVNLSKTATLKKTKIGFQDQLLLNAGQKYCRMLKEESNSAMLSTFIKPPFVI